MSFQKTLTRRQFATLVGAGAGTLMLPRPAFSSQSTAIGDAEITILSDGNLSLPLDFVFLDAPKEALASLLKATGQSTEFLTPDCNITLARMDDQLVMFDVGAGSNFMPTAGKLADSLATAGIDPSEVTDVVFTHAHPDHLWGLLDDFDEPVFPDATYHMNRMEWDYWRADDTLDKTPEARKSFVVGAQNRLAVLEDRIELFDFGAEVLPGIEAVDTSGHTPGHTSFSIHSGSESVMVLGDAVTNFAISFVHPEWPSGSDQDTDQGIRTRIKLLDRLALEKTGVIGFHLPHPGLGRVEKDGAAYRFTA